MDASAVALLGRGHPGRGPICVAASSLVDLPPVLLTRGGGAMLFALVLGLLVGWLWIDARFRSFAQIAERWQERGRVHRRAYQRLVAQNVDTSTGRCQACIELESALRCEQLAAQHLEQIPACLRRLYLARKQP